eukprot:m.215309 g.215309  ORF g.215309 m.215309 type:complete len:1044 (-) comp15589_c5_seq11:589-3720(-)
MIGVYGDGSGAGPAEVTMANERAPRSRFTGAALGPLSSTRRSTRFQASEEQDDGTDDSDDTDYHLSDNDDGDDEDDAEYDHDDRILSAEGDERELLRRARHVERRESPGDEGPLPLSDFYALNPPSLRRFLVNVSGITPSARAFLNRLTANKMDLARVALGALQFHRNLSLADMEVLHRFIALLLEDAGVVDSRTKFTTTFRDVQERLDLRQFCTLVVCPACHAVYSQDDLADMRSNASHSVMLTTVCIDDTGRHVEKTVHVATCCAIPFPNGSGPVCRERLERVARGQRPHGRAVEHVITSPRATFQYQPLVQFLSNQISLLTLDEVKKLYARAELLEERPVLRDFCDGRLFKEFHQRCQVMYEAARAQHTLPMSHFILYLGVALSVDFVSPFRADKNASADTKSTKIGGMYIVFYNIHPTQRWKAENVMTMGIMEGEPPIHMNGYLHFFVEELMELGEFNQRLFTTKDNKKVAVVVQLLQCCGDKPGRSKVTQVSHHAAKFGCSDCYVVPEDIAEEGSPAALDWSCPHACRPRTMADVVRFGAQHQRALDKADAERIRGENFGIRYSVLLRLERHGFDIIRMNGVDSLHGLNLGVLKTVVCLYKEKFLDDKSKLDTARLMVQAVSAALRESHSGISCPRDDLLSLKDLGSVTGAEMSTFCLYYAEIVFSFANVEYVALLTRLALICRLFESYELTRAQIDEAEANYRDFLRDVKRLFPGKAFPFNFHQMTHFIDHLRDSGPAHGFWGFGLERQMQRFCRISVSGNKKGLLVTYARHLELLFVASLIERLLPGLSELWAADEESPGVAAARLQAAYEPAREAARASKLLRIGINCSLPGFEDTSTLVSATHKGHPISFTLLSSADYFQHLERYLNAHTVCQQAYPQTFRFHRAAAILGQTLRVGTGICARMPYIRHGDRANIVEYGTYYGKVRGFLTFYCVPKTTTAPAFCDTTTPPTPEARLMTMVLADWFTLPPATVLNKFPEPQRSSILSTETFTGPAGDHVCFPTDITGLVAFVECKPPGKSKVKVLRAVKIPFTPLF